VSRKFLGSFWEVFWKFLEGFWKEVFTKVFAELQNFAFPGDNNLTIILIFHIFGAGISRLPFEIFNPRVHRNTGSGFFKNPENLSFLCVLGGLFLQS